MHGLSVIAQIGISNSVMTQLTRMVAEDSVGNFDAQEIASRIVSYERNQAYQRTLFSQLQQPNRAETAVDEEMRNSVRYLKRSSNQLIKSLKGLRAA